MKLNEYLTNRLKEIFTEGKWVIGSNIQEQIIDLDWKDATKRAADLNTIADLTFHIHYYIAGVIKVLEGGPLTIKDEFSFDSPPVKSNQDWINLVNQFCKDSQKLIQLVENMTEEELLRDFTHEKYGTYYRNIDLMIEHTYYHMGQIVLIKKILKQ